MTRDNTKHRRLFWRNHLELLQDATSVLLINNSNKHISLSTQEQYEGHLFMKTAALNLYHQTSWAQLSVWIAYDCIHCKCLDVKMCLISMGHLCILVIILSIVAKNILLRRRQNYGVWNYWYQKTPLLQMWRYINWLHNSFWTRTGGWDFYYSHGVSTSSLFHQKQFRLLYPW